MFSLIFFVLLSLLSVLGYGIFFKKYIFNTESNNIGELTWVNHPSNNPNLDGWYKVLNVVGPQTNHHQAQFCLPNPGPPINITTVPGPCANAPNPACVGFHNGICQECMNPNGPSQQYLQGMVNNLNYQR